MGLFSSINPLSSVTNFINAVKNGDIMGAFQAASQIALTFATGGSGALVSNLIQQGIQQFGAQAMTQALGKEVVSMLGQQMIQRMGEQMGLPQAAIDAAQAAFCKECGDTAGYMRNHREAGNLGQGGFFDRMTISGAENRDAKAFLNVIMGALQASPAERGQASSALDAMEQMLEGMIRDIMDEDKRGSRGEKGEARSWIAAMAETLGKVLDDAWGEVQTKIDRISEVSGKSEKQRGKLMPSATAEFQGAMAEFNMIMQAVTTAIKTAGESSAAMARKQ